MKYFAIVLVFLTLQILPTYGQTIYVTKSEINAIRQNAKAGKQPWAAAYNSQIKKANNALKLSPRSVVDNGGPAAAKFDKHTYGEDRTYATDGILSKEANKEDSKAYYAMSGAILDLGLAYGLTGDDRYARKAIDLIYHWCVNPSTYMKPIARNYSPHTQGGKSHGSITIYAATPFLIFGASFVMDHSYWNSKGNNAQAKFMDWVSDMYQSAVKLGGENSNNIYTHYLEMRAVLAAMLDDRAGLNKTIDLWKSHIKASVKPNGRLQRDANRTRGIDYSIYGLDPFAKVAVLARNYGENLWKWEDGQGGAPLRRAYDYLLPYVLDPNIPSKWIKDGGEQISSVGLESVSQVYEMGYAAYGDSKYLQAVKLGSRNDWHTLLFSGSLDVSDPGSDSDSDSGSDSGSDKEVATNKAPSVEIVSPSSGGSIRVPSTLTIEADASDSDGSVKSVILLVNGSKVAEVSSKPYTFNWSIKSGGKYTLVARAVDDKGATSNSSSLSFNATSSSDNAGTISRTLEIPVSSDAYVRGGSYEKDNFDRDGLIVKASSKSYTRESYVKIDLSRISGSVESAILRLQPTYVGGKSVKNEAALVANNNWDERSITWKSKPASSTVLAKWTPVKDKAVEIDVTEAVQKSLDGDMTLSLRIYAPSRGGDDDYVIYGCKDGNTAHPVLLVTTSGEQHSSMEVKNVRSVSASSDDGNVPSNTLDGSLSTRWSADGKGQWIQYELDKETTIGSVGIAWYNGKKRKAHFDIQTSSDGKSWTKVYSGSSSGKQNDLEPYDVNDTKARFIRIVGKGNTSNTWNSITEVAFAKDVVSLSTFAASSAASKNLAAQENAEAAGGEQPLEFSLEPNYPNPFNPTTTIAYQLPEDAPVRLSIYNVAGQLVRTLVNETQQAGHYSVEWNGRDETGQLVGSGLYLYRLEAGTFRQNRTMIMVK